MKIIKIITLILGLFVLTACATPPKKSTYQYDQFTHQQCQQQTTDFKQAYDDLKQDYEKLLDNYQDCLENKLPSANQAYREIKGDYRDARRDHNQCQQEVSVLTKQAKSCQVNLQLHKDNQEGYKKLPDKGFE